MRKQSNAYGWVVTFAGTGINLALGALYAWSVFKKPLASAFSLNDKQTALPYSIAIIIFAIMMVPAGRLQDKIGPRFVAMLGGILVGLGFFIASFAVPGNALPYLVIGFGVFAGAGIGLGYASATPPAVKWFPASKKGLIVGLVVGGFGLASVYVAPLTQTLLDSKAPKPAVVAKAPVAAANTASVPTPAPKPAPVSPADAQKFSEACSFAFRTLAIIFAAAVIILSQFIKNPPEGYKAEEAAGPAKKGAPAPAAKRDMAWTEMMKTPQFYIIWLMFVFGAGAGLMVISFMAPLAKALTDAGKIAFAGFVFVGILAVGNASGRIIAGMLSDRIGRARTMLLVFVVQAVVLVLFPQLESTVVFVIGTLIVGFNYGACLSVFPSITADFYGMKNLGMNYGLVFTAWGVGGFIMPLIAGAIKDSTGSYIMAFYVAAGICLVAAAMTFIVKPPATEASMVKEYKAKNVEYGKVPEQT